MSLTKAQQNAVLAAARGLIGTKYSDLDCSHFVHRAYARADLNYPYVSTAAFSHVEGKYFEKLSEINPSFEAADVLMFSGHVGLWDAEGCQVLQTAGVASAECTRFDNALPFLSSRSGGNRGPDFGMMKWFGKLKAVYRWKGGAS